MYQGQGNYNGCNLVSCLFYEIQMYFRGVWTYLGRRNNLKFTCSQRPCMTKTSTITRTNTMTKRLNQEKERLLCSPAGHCSSWRGMCQLGTCANYYNSVHICAGICTNQMISLSRFERPVFPWLALSSNAIGNGGLGALRSDQGEQCKFYINLS